jgi:hypothetical protein
MLIRGSNCIFSLLCIYRSEYMLSCAHWSFCRQISLMITQIVVGGSCAYFLRYLHLNVISPSDPAPSDVRTVSTRPQNSCCYGIGREHVSRAFNRKFQRKPVARSADVEGGRQWAVIDQNNEISLVHGCHFASSRIRCIPITWQSFFV